MKFKEKSGLLASTMLAGLTALSLGATPAIAQDVEQVDPDAQQGETAPQERITVTGSRIRRDAFSSAQPLQVVDADSAVALGSVDAAAIIAQSTTLSGEQIGGAINTASGQSNATEIPPDGGVGSQNVGLRGLDAERTLVLMNGRRIAPAGVGGAPTRPDLGLIPSSLIERVEILTGGASSIYGADAVAGVVNIITKTDTEGLEIDLFRSFPEIGGGAESRVSLVMGQSSDNGFINFAAEYFERTATRFTDMPGPHCDVDIRDIFDGNGDLVNRQTLCVSFFPDNAVSTSNNGELWFYQPGESDTFTDLNGNDVTIDDWVFRTGGIWADDQVGSVFDRFLWAVDSAPGYTAPQEFGEFNDNDERLNADFRQAVRTFSFVTTGEMDLEITDDFEPTFFFEQFYSNRQTRSRAMGEQALPELPGFIPELNAAGDDWVRDGSGNAILVDNPLNPFPEDAEGIFIMDEDFTQVREAEVEQIRFVGGLRGDFNSIFGLGSNWAYEGYGSYDRSLGYLAQEVLFSPNIVLGSQYVFLDNDGTLSCGIPQGLPGGFSNQGGATVNFNMWPDATVDRCQPIDWFAPSVLEDGAFATENERDFVTALRTNRTTVEQVIFGGFVSGDLWEMPGGVVGTAFGMEYRIDKIDSSNDVTVTRGLQASETLQSESNAAGETWQRDIFGEISLPLISDVPLIQDLTLDLSARHTEEKNFGGETTYGVRTFWQVNDWFALRGSYNTAFRAPNLREQFLADNASGTTPSGGDPCRVPALARVDTNNDGVFEYDAAQDTRDPNLLAQCFASGTDPTALALASTSSVSVPVLTSGNVELMPETAETVTAGFVIQPDTNWNAAFDYLFDDFSASVTYWGVQIEDTVEELSAGSVIAGCFNGQTPTLTSALCDRIERLNTGNPANNGLASVTIDFVNRGIIETDGLDVNLRFGRDFNVFDRDFYVQLASNNSYVFSYKEQAQAGDPFDQDVGEDFRPRWTSDHNISVLTGDWAFNWQMRYTSGVGTRDRNYVNFPNGFTGGSAWCEWTNPNDRANPLDGCTVRVLEHIDEYWQHNTSVTYERDTWRMTVGVSNVFDERVRIDSSSGIRNRNGYVVGGRYDTAGRRAFISLNKRF